MVTWEYLAGFIDGEGCIGIACHRYKETQASLRITNTNLSVLESIRDFIGHGRIYTNSHRTTVRSKQSYTYNLYSTKELGEVLSQIVDFLIVKNRQAELVLEFLELVQGNGKNMRCSPSIKGSRIELYRQVKLLNTRGIAA